MTNPPGTLPEALTSTLAEPSEELLRAAALVNGQDYEEIPEGHHGPRGKCWISAKNSDEQPGFQMISGDLAMNNLGFQMILPCEMEISGDLCIIDWEENLKTLNLRSKIWSLNLKELDTHTHVNIYIYIYISIKQRDLKGFGHE